jgi:outer membrane immunogenic protein
MLRHWFPGLLLALAAVESSADDRNSDGATAPESGDLAFRRWDQFYVGTQGILPFGTTSSHFERVQSGAVVQESPESPSVHSLSPKGEMGGIELGGNYRFGNFVLGPEFEMSAGRMLAASSESGVLSATGNPPYVLFQKSDLTWLGSLRGRLGVAASDRFLFYATGGFAAGGIGYRSILTFPETGHIYEANRAQIHQGWSAGAGIETALTDNWSVKLEYLHFDLGDAPITGYLDAPISYHTETDAHIAGDLFRLGVTYNFGDRTEKPYSKQDGGEEDWWMNSLRYKLGTGISFSSGIFAYDLHAPSAPGLLSRLYYNALYTESGELFGEIYQPYGAFLKVKGTSGSIADGSMNDQDFLNPDSSRTKYSSTISTQHNGTLSSATIDLGYTVLHGDWYELSPFVGYDYSHESLEAYGCTQTTNAPDCGGVSRSTLDIAESADWSAARVGVATELQFFSHFLTIDLNLAWLAGGHLNGTDTHWYRQNDGGSDSLSGAITQSGFVQGGEIETIATVPIARQIDVGLGARYWYASSTGSSLFPVTGRTTTPETTNFMSSRYALLAQVSLRL